LSTVTGRITRRGIGNVIADVQSALAQPGVTYTLGGLYQQQQIAFAGLVRVFLAALFAEFARLLLLYESFLLAGAILVTSLLSTSAVFTGLYLTNIELNITALMGMTMIIGIATEIAKGLNVCKNSYVCLRHSHLLCPRAWPCLARPVHNLPTISRRQCHLAAASDGIICITTPRPNAFTSRMVTSSP
jgi:hypothetical protein